MVLEDPNYSPAPWVTSPGIWTCDLQIPSPVSYSSWMRKNPQHTGPNLLKSTWRGAAMSPNNSHLVLCIVTPWKIVILSLLLLVLPSSTVIRRSAMSFVKIWPQDFQILGAPWGNIWAMMAAILFLNHALLDGAKKRNVLVRHFKVNIVLWDANKKLVDWWGGQTFGLIVYGSMLKPSRGDSDWNLTPAQLGFE